LNVLQALILGILQGLTEFLPISSSGHLVIAQNLLGLTEPELLFDVGVHFATMIAVIIYFRRELVKLIAGFLGGKDKAARRTAFGIIWGTLPAVIAGITLKDFFESLFNSPKTASVMLLATGAILLSSLAAKSKNKKIWGIRWLDAVLIGCAQALASLPGFSRSGSTIVAGLYLGLKKEDAAKFSFLLALPAIFGAGLLEAKELSSLANHQILPLIVGILAAGLTGYLAIAIMLKIVSQGKLYAFAPYCIILGLVVFLFTSF